MKESSLGTLGNSIAGIVGGGLLTREWRQHQQAPLPIHNN
jgi:hypothetical protein